MNKFIHFILFFFLITSISKAQTVLEKGDILVVGANYNNNCSDFANHDEVLLVGLKNILNETRIILTDNRYNGSNIFNVNEGFVQLERIHGEIERGQVFSINLLSSSLTPEFLHSDINDSNPNPNYSVLNGWKYRRRDSQIALSNSGDQLFIFSGYNWNSNNTFWENNLLITGYNSLNVWNNTISTNDSNLPVNSSSTNLNIENYHFTPNNSHKNFRIYNGIKTPTSRNEWLIRILNPQNWIAPNSCSNFINEANLLKNSSFQFIDQYENTVCINEEVSFTISLDSNSSSNSIQIGFQWYKTNDPNQPGSLISGANSRTLTTLVNDSNIVYYYCMITYRLSWKTTNSGPNINSDNTIKSALYKVNINNIQTSPIINIP